MSDTTDKGSNMNTKFLWSVNRSNPAGVAHIQCMHSRVSIIVSPFSKTDESIWVELNLPEINASGSCRSFAWGCSTCSEDIWVMIPDQVWSDASLYIHGRVDSWRWASVT